MRKNIISTILAVLLLVSMLPLTAHAANDGKAIRLGPAGGEEDIGFISYYKKTEDKLHKGVYYYTISHLYFGIYNGSPLTLRVLSCSDGKIELVTDSCVGSKPWHTDLENVDWKDSTIRSWLNGYDASENIGDYVPAEGSEISGNNQAPSTGDNNGIDYTGTGFIDTTFSPIERDAIPEVWVPSERYPNAPEDVLAGSGNTNDKIYLLSFSDVFSGTVQPDGIVRIARIKDPIAADGDYWLRTRCADYKATYVDGGGGVHNYWSYGQDEYGKNVNENLGVRPTFNISTDSVLFVSKSDGGKDSGANGLSAVSEYTGHDWKLTLLDESRSEFKAWLGNEDGNVWTVGYSGAKTGTNEYISSVIVNSSGSITYYGRLAQASASGTVTVDITGKMDDGDMLYIFNEQANGNGYTDYSSELVEMGKTFPVSVAASPAEGGTVTISGGMQTESGMVFDYGGTAAVTASPNPGYVFKNWSVDGRIVSTNAVFSRSVTKRQTLTANFAKLYTVTFVNYDGTVLQSTEIPEGDTPVYNGPTPVRPQNDDGTSYIFDYWYPDPGPVTGPTTYKAYYEVSATLPAFKSQSLSLGSNIGVIFFMELPEIEGIDYDTSYMTFSISGKGLCSKRADYKDCYVKSEFSVVHYGFECLISTIQMADTITATFHYFQNGVEKTVGPKQYRAVDYISVFDKLELDESGNYSGWINGKYFTFNKPTVDLVKALADYGHFIQPYLADVRGWNLGSDYALMEKCYTTDYEMSDLGYDLISSDEYLSGQEIVISNANNTNGLLGIKDVTFSLTLDSRTSLNIYFICSEEELELVEFAPPAWMSWDESLENVYYTETVRIPDGRLLLKIDNIAAHELSKKFTVGIDMPEGTTMFTLSALSYVKKGADYYKNILENSTPENALDEEEFAEIERALAGLAALYKYSAAADAYIEYEESLNEEP